MIYFTKDLKKDLDDAKFNLENSIKEAKEYGEYISSRIEPAIDSIKEEERKERDSRDSKAAFFKSYYWPVYGSFLAVSLGSFFIFGKPFLASLGLGIYYFLPLSMLISCARHIYFQIKEKRNAYEYYTDVIYRESYYRRLFFATLEIKDFLWLLNKVISDEGLNFDISLDHWKENMIEASKLFTYKKSYFYYKERPERFKPCDDEEGLNLFHSATVQHHMHVENIKEELIKELEDHYSHWRLVTLNEQNSYDSLEGSIIVYKILSKVEQIRSARKYLFALKELQKIIQASTTYCPKCKSPLSARSIEFNENEKSILTFDCSDCHLTFKN